MINQEVMGNWSPQMCQKYTSSVWLSLLSFYSDNQSGFISIHFTLLFSTENTDRKATCCMKKKVLSRSRVCASVAQSCLTLCDPMDCSLPGSSICGNFQARILGCVAMPSSKVSSQPRDWTWVFCINRWILYHWATREAQSRDQETSVLVLSVPLTSQRLWANHTASLSLSFFL